jgi:hypothetical protein
MTLFSHETTVGGAVDGIEDEIAEVEAELEAVAPEAAAHEPLVAARDSLQQQKEIFEAYVNQGEWAPDQEIKMSSLSAGDRAVVNREMSDDAGAYAETLWTVAAATDAAPWQQPAVSDCFAEVASLEAPIVDWAETVIGGLRGDEHPLALLRRTVISQTAAETIN